MKFKCIRSKEYLLFDTLENCSLKGGRIEAILRQLYENKKIKGYACLLVQDENDALDENIEIEEDQCYPFFWLNITYSSDNAPTTELYKLKEIYGLRNHDIGMKQKHL